MKLLYAFAYEYNNKSRRTRIKYKCIFNSCPPTLFEYTYANASTCIEKF